MSHDTAAIFQRALAGHRAALEALGEEHREGIERLATSPGPAFTSQGLIGVGNEFTSDVRNNACSEDLEADEPDTATIDCTCAEPDSGVTTHDEDEVYFVLEGRARMRLHDEEREVRPGMLLYVGASMEHSFFEIEEDMLLLVFFSA